MCVTFPLSARVGDESAAVCWPSACNLKKWLIACVKRPSGGREGTGGERALPPPLRTPPEKEAGPPPREESVVKYVCVYGVRPPTYAVCC